MVTQAHELETARSNTTLDKNRTTRTIRASSGQFVFDVWHAQHTPKATPIVLVHGWGGTGSYWTDTARLLSQTADVIVPDLPGTGRSKPVNGTQDMFDQVDTLIHLLDSLQLKQIQLVGHSMGGAMAVLIAAKQPERIKRLALVSLAFFMNKEQEDIYSAVMRVFKLSTMFRPKWLANIPGMPGMIAKQYFYRVPDERELLRSGFLDYLQLDRDTAIACANNATDPRIKAAGYKVKAPTLMIAAKQDMRLPLENVDYTANIIPNSDVRWIDECGHLPMVEKSDEFHAMLREFLTL